VIVDRDRVTLDRAAETLGANAVAVQGDVTKDADVEAAFAAATRRFGRLGLPAEMADGMEGQMAAQVPLKRVAQAFEIADAVVFLASSESRYVVGTELVVDGGMTQL
jgi:NAD(P)-dependent dehydrogenase (short-subunit alcohol dehydrogenase family)